jgi:hypothetical protein
MIKFYFVFKINLDKDCILIIILRNAKVEWKLVLNKSTVCMRSIYDFKSLTALVWFNFIWL